MDEIRREEEVVNDPANPTTTERVEKVTTVPESERVEQVTADPYAERRLGVYRVQQALYTILTIIEGLLLIRFVLKLLAANPASGFASFIYGITAPLVAPFYGLFPTPASGTGMVLELYTIVALIVYPLIFWVLVRLVWLIFGENRTGVVTHRVDTRRGPM